jgi:hypothetical protein
VLGDVMFYLLAVVMGHCAQIVAARANLRARSDHFENVCKISWFAIALPIAALGIALGSPVMRDMVLWLYLPFGVLAILLFKRFNAFQLWFPTIVFVACEFPWDAGARIMGTWIFPHVTSQAGLYLDEITFFHIGKYPIVWQPEMTQMAFISGMISLMFFLLSRVLFDEVAKVRTGGPIASGHGARMLRTRIASAAPRIRTGTAGTMRARMTRRLGEKRLARMRARLRP